MINTNGFWFRECPICDGQGRFIIKRNVPDYDRRRRPSENRPRHSHRIHREVHYEN